MPGVSLLKRIPCFFASLLLLAAVRTGFSQGTTGVTDLYVTAHNVGEGLSQSTVYRVLQDEGGLIWLTTGAGLQYFDGTGFRSFYAPEGATPGGYGSAMHDLAEVSPGYLVAATGAGLLRFGIAGGRFTIPEQPAGEYPLMLLRPGWNRTFCRMSSGRLYLVGERRLRPVRTDYLPGGSPPGTFMPHSAAQDGEGRLLLAGEQGILVLLQKPGDPDTVVKARWIPLNTSCRHICRDGNGASCLLAGGIIASPGRNGELRQVLETGIKDAGYLFVDRQRNYWITDRQSNQVYRIGQGRIDRISFIAARGKHADTRRPVVRDIFEDRNGNLWFATDGDGLLFYSPRRLMFGLADIGFTRCLAYYRDGIWTGTFRNGLWRLSPDMGSRMRVNPGKLGNELYFYDLATDTMGRLWAATSHGVFILDGQGTILYRFPFTTRSAGFIRFPGNKLLLSAYSDLFNCETGTIPGLTFIRHQTRITRLIIAGDHYWTCSHFGLFRTDTSAGMLSAMEFHEPQRLTTTGVYDILQLGGMIWVGTENGIACYSLSGKKTAPPSCVKELAHEVVYSLLADSRDNIWFSGNNGLGCIPAARDRLIRFTLRENLQSPEFNSNAALTLPTGGLCFGGIHGVNVLDAGSFTFQAPPPEVRLVSLQLSDSALSPGIPPMDSVFHIHWRSPHLSGQVFSPGYLPEGTAGFSFFLEGYQKGWSQPSADPRFSYRNLPPGEYVLWARCSDLYRNQGSSARLLRISIHPPFWKTWEFLALCGVLLVALTVLVIRKIQEDRNRRLIFEMERRHGIDRERLRISQDMHDEIGSSLTQIAILSEIAKKQKDDPYGVMKLVDRISGISGTLVDDMGEIIWAMNPKNDNLASFVSYLRQHASEYLADAGIETVLDFPDECPAALMTSEQRRNIFLVVKESLHNAVRHARASRVSLSLTYAMPFISVTVEDDGAGFDMEASGNIGNGLTGMRKRIETLGGSCFIGSEPGKGTRIVFKAAIGGSKTA